MNKVQNCSKCEYARMYDYDKRIYYCDHENRIDDMGKIGVDNLPEGIPEWCPLRCDEHIFGSVRDPIFGFGNDRNDCVFTEKPTECLWNLKGNMGTGDIIQMDTGTSLRDKDGNPIEIRVPKPEYMDSI